MPPNGAASYIAALAQRDYMIFVIGIAVWIVLDTSHSLAKRFPNVRRFEGWINVGVFYASLLVWIAVLRSIGG